MNEQPQKFEHEIDLTEFAQPVHEDMHIDLSNERPFVHDWRQRGVEVYCHGTDHADHGFFVRPTMIMTGEFDDKGWPKFKDIG